MNPRLACCLALSLAPIALSALWTASMSGCSASRSDPNGDLEGGGIPVPVPDGGLGGQDSAITPPLCPPVDAASFAPSWHPPNGPHLGLCTDGQLTALIDACFNPTSTPTTCSAWLYNVANAACLGCWQGSVDAGTWAPFVHADNPGETDYVNIGGCVALADPSEVTCAQAIQAEFECELASCLNDCPVPNPADAGAAAHASGLKALDSCYAYVDRTECASFVADVTACATPLEVASGPAGFCFTANGNNPDLQRLFTLVCGASDGGAAPEGGAGEAGLDGGADAPEDAAGGG